ncbi:MULTISPECIES: DUF6682 family protein [Vibrio]|uniref:phage adaptor protein n=1 Tax=Vibrio TaxID=662 RepID=UPI0011D50582|nr:DUF6682 family protein [Vibrio mimicus]EJL6538956.1 hypothetical protein [Vibrio cholerae]EJX7569578.1 hypothetical protein [Vibrio cholerae]TXY44613.1 hypothetical protein FXE78_20095 [Vibrio mimicus]HDI3293933.1 hypothetical protein [Vibrio cholerae]
MSVTIKGLIDRVARDLIDVRHVRWSRPELMDFVNDAISAMVIRRPDLSRTTAMIESSSYQVSLPADAYQILAVNHINQQAAQFVNIHKLNQLYPEWRKTAGVPVCWTRNELDETTLFLYPSPQAPVNVELVYSRTLQVASESDVFPLPEIYLGVVSDFVMYRAYNKDSQNPAEGQKAQLHLQAFATALGDKTVTDNAKAQMIQSSEGAR